MTEIDDREEEAVDDIWAGSFWGSVQENHDIQLGQGGWKEGNTTVIS